MLVKINSIKPCPFCGAKPFLYDGCYVIHHLFDCFIMEIYGNSNWIVNDRVAEKWNNRIEKGKK